MRELGQDAADCWLESHLDAIGIRSTMDLAEFVGPILGPHIGVQRVGGSQA